MTWLDTARDPSQPVGTRIAYGIGCGALPWLCISQQAQARIVAASEAVDGASSFGDELRDTIDTIGEAAAAPAAAASSALMWASVLVGLLLLLVVIALVLWYVILPSGIRGGVSNG